MAFARFHPQAWQGNYAVPVDPEGPTDWDVGDVPDTIKDNTYESDNLRDHANAPEWVKRWTGPFWIEIIRE